MLDYIQEIKNKFNKTEKSVMSEKMSDKKSLWGKTKQWKLYLVPKTVHYQINLMSYNNT